MIQNNGDDDDGSPENVKAISAQLSAGTYECAVCTDSIQHRSKLWNCPTCYGVFHLPCVVRWAKSQQEQEKKMWEMNGCNTASSTGVVRGEAFRCPLCQNVCPMSSTKYFMCYCGKVQEPAVDVSLVPGSCGQTCEKKQKDKQCPHCCTLMCHPGSCPPCTRTRSQTCYCGQCEKLVGCSSGVDGYECGKVCNKLLPCGNHTCTVLCHEGPCPVCRITHKATCFCGAHQRTVMCGADSSFSCRERCHKKRDCGVHECGMLCHSGPCQPCLRTPYRQRTCACGKTELADIVPVPPARSSCEDTIPSCGKVCGQPLPCEHFCKEVCHDSPCPPCKQLVPMTCECGATTNRYPCFVMYLPQDEWKQAAATVKLQGPLSRALPSSFPVRCESKCKAQLSCGKHVCGQKCCAKTDHTCYQICRKKAPCGIHECGMLCHRGPCPPCQNTSYERLYCRCRRTWIEPPVPCCTKPPSCSYPCVVPRPCGHPANHPCHSDGECPQCVVPVEKYCGSHGKKMPFYRPCYDNNISCGKTCGKVISCCRTTCSKPCHMGACEHDCKNAFPELGSIK